MHKTTHIIIKNRNNTSWSSEQDTDADTDAITCKHEN